MDSERLSVPAESKDFFERVYAHRVLKNLAEEARDSEALALDPARLFSETLRGDNETSPLIPVGATEDGHLVYVRSENLGSSSGEAFVTCAGVELNEEQFSLINKTDEGIRFQGTTLALKKVYGIVLAQESFADVLSGWGFGDVHSAEDLERRKARAADLNQAIQETVERVKDALMNRELTNPTSVEVQYPGLRGRIQEERRNGRPMEG